MLQAPNSRTIIEIAAIITNKNHSLLKKLVIFSITGFIMYII